MAAGGTKVVLQAIFGNGFITILKFFGYFVTASPSLMAEAVHSMADTFNQILLYIGMRQAKGKPTREYSTGYGGASYVWNLVSAVGIFFLGFGITFYHGIHSLIEPHGTPVVSWIGIGVLIISFIIEMWVLFGAIKEVNRQRGSMSYLQFFRESDDPTVLAVLLEDGIAVLGVVLAMFGLVIGQVTGSAIFDSIIAIIISLLLGFLAIALGVINGKLLMGKSVPIHKEEDIKNFIEAFPQVHHIEKINTKIIGAGKVRLSVEVKFHGERLIDENILKQDQKDLESGQSPHKVLINACERMVRITGREINQMELEIHRVFPEVAIIDFEVA